MRRPSIRGLAVALPVLASLAACTPTPTILPSNDLNRPTDMAFMCLGAFGQPGTDADGNPTEVSPFIVSGRPMSVCHPPAVADQKTTPPLASIHNRTFAFITNSASGDMSVVDADTWKIVDLNRATGGYGRVPLGTLPEQISTTNDGCRLVSANRGSCNLSLVDPSRLLAPLFAAQFNNATAGVSVDGPTGSPTQRIEPRRPTDGTPLDAAPYEAVFLPQDISQINNCPVDGAAPMTPWRALVTFPSCSLIALVDLPSGDIVASVKARRITTADGLESVALSDAGTDPVCPAECLGRGAGDPDAGAGPADGGAPAPGTGTGPQPTGIAIWPDATRAYVSFSNVSAVVPIDLSPTTLTATAPAEGIPLHGAQGSNRIRLGVDPYSVKIAGQGFPGRFVGDNKDRSYLYVIARDGSLRIVDVFVPSEAKECETNFDALNPYNEQNKPDPSKPLSEQPPPKADNRCIPYGSLNRRPYSQDTAGLRFPTFPIDVAAADMGRIIGDQGGDHREDTVAGGYAWVLTANGLIYLVNIDPVQRSIKAVVHDGQTVLFDPDPASVATYADNGFVYKNDPASEGGGALEPPPFPNRPRDRNFLSYSTSLDPALGLVRLDIPPIALINGPYLEPLWTQGTEDNATAVDPKQKQTYVFFPDRDGAVAQAWDITWQGTLVSPRYSGVLRGNVLRDGAGFCGAGVLAGDIVTLNGCTTNAQCPLGMVCQRDTTVDQVPGGFTVTGLCVSSKKQEGLEDACAPYVSTVRRYEIAVARNTEVTLVPHLDEIVRSSLSPCHLPGGGVGTGGAGGMGGAGGAGGAAGMAGAGGSGGAAGGGGAGGGGGTGGAGGLAANDCVDPNDSSTYSFECVDLVQGDLRCLQPCASNQDCRNGRVCHALPGCTDVSQCPAGTTACRDGLCFTDIQCNPQRSCETNQTCYATTEPDANGNQVATTRCIFNRSFCADGPPLVQNDCFPQLTGYQVSVNAGFMVTGTQSGSFASGVEVSTPDGPQCAPNTNRDPRLVSRIPLRPARGQQRSSIECGSSIFPPATTDPEADGYFFDRFDSRLAPVLDDANHAGPLNVGPYTITQEAPQLVDWMKDWTADVNAPNACIYKAGPIASDPTSTADPTGRPDRPQHVRARFRNTQIAFVLANLDRAPAGASTIHFEVHGGFRPQFVVMPTTVEVSAPARLLLGPIDSPQEAKVTPGPAPYFFVVDQRRLGRGQGGGPTRGQIVRVNPFGLQANGYLPIYEDYQRSGNLFPIQ